MTRTSPPCCISSSLNFASPLPFLIFSSRSALPSSSLCTRSARRSIFAPSVRETSSKSPPTLPFSTSMASITSRLLPIYMPKGCAILLMTAVTLLPTCLPISAIMPASLSASAAFFIKAPLPHFTSSTISSAPAAIFFDIMLAAIRGMLSTVPVTSRRA